MKTDYITSGSTLPPYLSYPWFLLGMNIRLTAKEVGPLGDLIASILDGFLCFRGQVAGGLDKLFHGAGEVAGLDGD